VSQESTLRITNHVSRFTQSQRWLAPGIVALLIILYIAVFSALAVARHEAFETLAFDLGDYDQAVWNTIHGRILRLTNVEGLTTRLAMHVEPILLPVSLFYLIYSSPKTLLVLQTVAVALGAWPVYLLAREKMQSEFGGVVFALAYLLFPALESANLFDFHAVTLAPVFLLSAFYFLEELQGGHPAIGGTDGSVCLPATEGEEVWGAHGGYRISLVLHSFLHHHTPCQSGGRIPIPRLL